MSFTSELPFNWKEIRVKNIADIFGRIGYRGYTVADIVGEGEGALSVSPGNIFENRFTLNAKTFISWKKYEESPEIKLREKDVIIVKTGSTIGKIAIVPKTDFKLTLNPQVVVLKNIKLDNQFLYYSLCSEWCKFQFEIYQSGGATPAISQEKIGNFRFSIPPKPEQTAISNYLDKKTTTIDKKTALLQQKIETYKKLRKAIINKAVTKGLDDKETNKKWKLQRVKDLVVICNGKDYKEVQSDDGKYDVFGSGGAFEKSTEFIYDKPSVLLGRKGTIDKPILVEKPFWAVDTMFYSKMKAKTDAKFFYYFTTTIEFGFYEYGSALPSITQNDLNRILLYFPQIKEQRQIAEYLDQKTATIDKIVENLQTQIATLQHLRKVLINDAVTGKIKVV